MTFLPIVQRELQSRARRGTTYWGRCLVAGAAVLFCFQFFLTYGFLWDAPECGRAAYTALTVMALLLSCSGVLLTADCVSVERREGTLGLLFLTDLKGYDVALGKLAANGLDAIYILVGFAPVVGMTLLAGGITGGETFRIMLAILNTLWLALAVGLCISTRSQSQFVAMRGAILCILGLALLPLPCSCIPFAFLLSPVYTFWSAGAQPYSVDPDQYWRSLAAVHVISWFFLAIAAHGISRKWRTGTEQTLEPDAENTYGPMTWAEVAWEARSNLVKFGPICSGALRMPGQLTIAWIAALVWMSNVILWAFRSRWSDDAIVTGFAVSVNLVTDLGCAGLVAWCAGRFIFESRQSGGLELLMCTPAGASEIVSGQWRVMKRLLLIPAICMLSLTLGLGLLMHSMEDPWPLAILHTGVDVIGGVAFLFATCWLGMWLGSRQQKLPAAIAWTVGIIVGIPWLVTSAVCALILGPDTTDLTYTILNLTISIAVGVYHWVLYRRVRRKMEWDFSNYSKLSWSQFVESASEEMTIAVKQ